MFSNYIKSFEQDVVCGVEAFNKFTKCYPFRGP